VGFDETGVFILEPPTPERIVDVTGAGDALAGGTAAACLAGLPLSEALRHGAAAAMLALESSHSVPELSRGRFDAALAQVPQPFPLP
jgi:sugar/nucleoside kinase (ribokinase family)